MRVVFYNGAFIAEEDVSISINSRAFNYGDGFFESVKIINTKPFNLSYHLKRIKLAFSLLKLSDNYTEAFFEESILDLLKRNKVVNGSIKIHISRIGAGRYLPISDSLDLFISSSNGSAYKSNNAISLCFYEDECKSLGNLSNIKSVSSLVSVLASIYASENNFDNAILFNASGNIIEVSNANIFIVKNEKIYTPPLIEGCVDGTMRRWVSNWLDIFERPISKDEILDADEVFITNATNGIVSVKIIEDTYFSSFSMARCIQKKLVSLSLDL